MDVDNAQRIDDDESDDEEVDEVAVMNHIRSNEFRLPDDFPSADDEAESKTAKRVRVRTYSGRERKLRCPPRAQQSHGEVTGESSGATNLARVTAQRQAPLSQASNTTVPVLSTSALKLSSLC